MARKLNLCHLKVTFLNDSEGESELLHEYAMRLLIYAAIIAIFLMIMALILQLLGKSNGDEGSEDEGTRASENSKLLSSKEDVLFSNYGTGEDGEYCLESGKGSCSSSSDDLYDGKICIICYDDQRNCFFVPCGHCIACYTCANRIRNEESKSCPICRGHIHKVRKLCVVKLTTPLDVF